MRRSKIAGLVMLAMLALSATVTGTAAASPKTLGLTDQTGRSLVPAASDQFELYGEQNLSFTLAGGARIECTGEDLDGLQGQLLSNGQTKDSALIEQARGALGHPGGEACESTSSLGGHPELRAINFPWTLTLATSGAAQLLGKPLGLTLEFNDERFGAESGALCTYEAAKLKGTFPVSTVPGRLALSFSDGKLKLNKASSKACPKTAVMSLSLPESLSLFPNPNPEDFDFEFTYVRI
jgi:hypothetical protein